MLITYLKQTIVKKTANTKDTGLPCSDVLSLFSAGKGQRSVGRDPSPTCIRPYVPASKSQNDMRPVVSGHRLTLVDFCHCLVLTSDRGLRRFCSLLAQDMHVHVWMFLMRWFYFSEGWLYSILNKHLGHPHTPSEEGPSYNKSKAQSLKHQRED